MLTISKMDHRGDVPREFDVADPQALAEAEALFKRLQDSGYNAYKLEKAEGGGSGGLVETFDPQQSVLMVPNLWLG